MKFVSVILLFFAVFSCLPEDEIPKSASISKELVALSGEKRSFTYINLARSVDRNQMMIDQLSLAKLNYHRFDAVEGKLVDTNKLVADGLYDQVARDKKPLTPGEIGVYLSNIRIWENFEKSSSPGLNFILEDDAIIPIDADQELSVALRSVPKDWDMLYLACNLDLGADPEQNYLVQSPYRKWGKLVNTCSSASLEQVEGTPWLKMGKNCVAGAYAYGVNQERISYILSQIKPMKEPIDLRYRDLFGEGKLQAYCLNPSLIRTRYSAKSTIR